MLSTNPPKPHANPWPEKIKKWLENDAYHSGAEPAMRQAIATDPRLASVAARLGSLSYFDDPEVPAFTDGGLHAFLDRLLAVPGTWRFLSARPKDFVAGELADLRTESDRYLGALRKHGYLAELYLAGWSVTSAEQIEQGKRRFAELKRSIEAIRDLAAAGAHVFAPGDFPYLGRKRKYKKPGRWLTIFFVRQLAKNARAIFGEHLYEEIALLATVCLELDEPLGRDDVRELCNPKRVMRGKRASTSKSKRKRVIRRKRITESPSEK